MSRYFFDTFDGQVSQADEDGMDLPDLVAVRRVAQDALPDLARDKLPDGDTEQRFAVSVRNQNGPVYSVSLDLKTHWSVEPPE